MKRRRLQKLEHVAATEVRGTDAEWVRLAILYGKNDPRTLAAEEASNEALEGFLVVAREKYQR